MTPVQFIEEEQIEETLPQILALEVSTSIMEGQTSRPLADDVVHSRHLIMDARDLTQQDAVTWRYPVIPLSDRMVMHWMCHQVCVCGTRKKSDRAIRG